MQGGGAKRRGAQGGHGAELAGVEKPLFLLKKRVEETGQRQRRPDQGQTGGRHRW